ncbi:MAG: LLM class F420-dependent oxidoreductase [Myxococcota bacterium]|nr:LLM class F420-dependent oxidoreductase [Myxococcota bacterium]
MKIGLFSPFSSPIATPEYLWELGRAAEERGFHALWAAEHVVLFDEYASRYPYSNDGRIPVAPDAGFLDPFCALNFLAAATSRIRLGTGICLVPQRNPVYTAKEVTTLDWLSGGRVDFGVGVGWLAEEFEAVEASFARRGARCREYLAVMQTLWRDSVSEFKGEFYTLAGCRQYPKPVQAPHPPIWFGGESEAALRRVADLGQGWYGFNLDPESAEARIKRLEVLLRERGRSLDEIEVAVSPYLKPIEPTALARYREAGVDQVVVLGFARDADALPGKLDEIAERWVVPAQRL